MGRTKTKVFTRVYVREIVKMAEEGGFEPPVRVDPARLFSKQLVSATHPLLRTNLLADEGLKVPLPWLGINSFPERAFFPQSRSQYE